MTIVELRDEFRRLAALDITDQWLEWAGILSEAIENSVPLKGPPDRFARTADGLLMHVGMKVYDRGGGCHDVVALFDDRPGFADAIQASLTYDGVFSAPQEPQTPLEALRQLVDDIDRMIEHGRIAYDVDFNGTVMAARELFGKLTEPAEPVEMVFTCPSCGGHDYHDRGHTKVCTYRSDCGWRGTNADFRAACKPKVNP